MKLLKLFMLLFLTGFMVKNVTAQQLATNANINIVTANAGVVNQGALLDLSISVTNTGANPIQANRVRPSISIPTAIASAAANALQTGLPAGWIITANTGGVITICNGTDVIPAGVTRVAIIKIQGTAIGGPSTIGGTLQFGPGTGVCTGFGALNGDAPADNISQTSMTVQAAPACALGVSASAGTIACNGGTTTLTATASGATGAVEYSLNGGTFQASNTFTANAVGSPYTVTAREVANTACSATSSAVTVSQPAAFVPGASVSSPIAAIGGTGSITVTGGVSYTIASGTTTNTTGATSGVFSGLLAGTYTFTATNAAGCTGTSAAVVLNDPAACIIISVSASAGTISCNGGTTTLTATATPAGTYQYSLNGGAFQASNTFTVSGGTYTVVARETANTVCSATSSAVTVTAPAAISATAAVSTPIAVPGGTGAITVSATGGTGAKTYVITTGTTINTTGATSGVFTGLLAGSYTFTATDANACTAVSAPTTLTNPGIATADPAVGQMYFTTTTGAAQSANSLLMAPSFAVYDINIPFYNRNQFNVVPNGTINFRVNLGSKLVVNPGFNLATAPLATYFSFAQSIVGGNVIITGTQMATIPADFDAIATFRVKGNLACRSNVVSNIVITNVLQTLTDDDLQNNQATLQYTLPVTLSKTQVNVTCNGLNNGIINLTVSSGTSVSTTRTGGGYTNTTGVASGVNNFTLSNLAPGTYTIVASATSDASLASCSETITVVITEPSILSIPAVGGVSSTNIICFGGANGTITVTATGGTAPYTYTISGPGANTTGVISGVFTGLTAGSYTVTVTDNNLCGASPASGVVVITQPVGGIPDITLGSDVTGSLFTAPGVSQTIVYNIAEIGGNAAVGDTLRINKVNGFTINFNPTLFSTIVGGTTYALDNSRWKIDNSNPAFVSIILTDPLNASAPGTLLCNTLVRVAVTLTRNTSDISTFTLSARLRKANGEVNLTNNLNSIIFAAD